MSDPRSDIPDRPQSPAEADGPLPLEYRNPSTPTDAADAQEYRRVTITPSWQAFGSFCMGCVYAIGSTLFGVVVLNVIERPGADHELALTCLMIVLVWIIPLIVTARSRKRRPFALGLAVMAGIILIGMSQLTGPGG